MLRSWLCLLLLTAALAVLPRDAAHAQQKSAPTQITLPQGTLSPEQARAALDTLNDPKKRAAFAATLDALIKGQPDPDPPPPPPPPPGETPDTTAAKPADTGIAIQLQPDSLGAQVLLSASSFLNRVADEVPRAMEAVQSLPLLWGWVVVMATNPLGQRLLIDVTWRLAVVLAVGIAVAFALRTLLRRPMERVLALGRQKPACPKSAITEDAEARAEHGDIEPPPRRGAFEGAGRRLGLGLARFALQMVPVLGLQIAGHIAAASSVGGQRGSSLVILAVLEAIAASQTLLALLTLLFEPEPPGLKLLAIRRLVGEYLVRWGRRLILIAVPGYTIGEIGLLLGLSAPAHGALQKAVGLALTICLGIIVLQRRRTVGHWLGAPPDATGAMAQFRNRVARYWWWVALLFLAATWLSWTLRAPDAMARNVWYFTTTALVVAAAALARVAIVSLLRPLRLGPVTEPGSTQVLTIRSRLGVYHPVLRRSAQFVINVIAVLGLFQIYGLGGLTWLLTSEVGHRIASGIGTLAVTIGLALAVWEGVNIAIQMHLETLRREAQVARSARMRTLLPLIRTTLAITVTVVAGLMVLSEIGVNIGPLLAGAGIVGVAIGFGSQKLVQDVITGVFLLLENTMQVGDVVRVGDQSGLVESLSVRTIRLRTEDGSVVVIPFSAVTTVINMTRDYSRAVISVNVSAGEDIDRVTETMRGILREMRQEDAWSAIILDDLEMWGVDRYTDTAVQIKCRVMCTPFGRWPVAREFNRRLKKHFEVVGVPLPFSAMKLLEAEPTPAPIAEAPAGARAPVQ